MLFVLLDDDADGEEGNIVRVDVVSRTSEVIREDSGNQAG